MIFAIIILCSVGIGIVREIFAAYEPGKRKYFTRREIVSGAIPGGLIGLMIAAAGLLFVSCGSGKIKFLNGDYSGCTEKVYNTPIASIVREQSYQSSFVIGTGGGNTTRQYYAYVPHNKGMLLEQFDVSTSFIIEGDYAPHYKRVDYMCPSTALKWYIGIDRMKYNKGPSGTFYVPKGTILREFKL